MIHGAILVTFKIIYRIESSAEYQADTSATPSQFFRRLIDLCRTKRTKERTAGEIWLPRSVQPTPRVVRSDRNSHRWDPRDVVRVQESVQLNFVQSPPSGRRPMFGETFALNPMFTFFAVQTQLHFSTAANYENNLPPNVGLWPDGGLCIPMLIIR